MRTLAPALLLALTAAAPIGDTRTVMISGFERIRVDGPYDVRVVTGGPFAARIDGSRIAIDRVNVRVDGGTLVVAAGDNDVGARREGSGAPVQISVTVPDSLHAALVNGAGRLTIDRLKAQHVDLGVNGAGTLGVGTIEADDLVATLTGTGAMTLGGNAGHATFSSYGAGSVQAAALVVRDLVVRASSSGSASFTARYTARINSIGVGSLSVAGQPQCAVTGSGPVTCGEKP